MTDLLEQRLRSAMSPPDRVGPGDGGLAGGGPADLERWSRIEAAAQRRRNRSDLAQRVAMVTSVLLVAGSALALGSGNLFGLTETGSGGKGGMGVEAQEELSSSHTVLRWLVVLGLTVTIGNGIALLWRRIPDWYFAIRPSSSGRWGRILGTIIILGGLAGPLWATVNFLSKYDGVSYVGSDRDLLPFTTVAGFTIIAVGAFLGWRGTSVGSWLGALLLTASALQAGLALRALFRVRVLFDQHGSAIDNTRSDTDFNTFRRQVGNVGSDLYPFGSASLVFLLAPWIVGSILVFRSRRRTRAWSISLGLAVTVATYVTFHSMDSDFMNLID